MPAGGRGKLGMRRTGLPHEMSMTGPRPQPPSLMVGGVYAAVARTASALPLGAASASALALVSGPSISHCRTKGLRCPARGRGRREAAA